MYPEIFDEIVGDTGELSEQDRDFILSKLQELPIPDEGSAHVLVISRPEVGGELVYSHTILTPIGPPL